MAQKFKNQIDAQEGIKITNELYDGSNAAGASGQVLSSTGTGTQWIANEADVAKRLEITVKNVNGGSLAKGTVVHAAPSATPPSGNVIEVDRADANDATKMPAIGVLNETIANEAEGEAVMFGAVSGIDTSSFSIGDELYVSTTAGALTATKPTANDELVQKVAIVIKSHASNGLIKVFGAGRANDVPNQIDRNVNFTDNSKLTFGDSTTPDLKIYHDGSNSYIIDAGTGGLTIQANADFALQSTGTNENFITAATNAFVKLYFDGNEKLATTNTGVDITGGATFSGTITASGGSSNNNDDANILTLNASEHARLLVDTSSTSGHRATLALESNGNELLLTTTGSASELTSVGNLTVTSSATTFTGSVTIRKSALGGSTAMSDGTLVFGAGSTNYFSWRLDSGADLYLDKVYGGVNANVLSIDRSTTNGDVTFAGNIILGDTPQIQLGTNNDAQIDHTGSHLFIDNSVGNSYLRNTSTGSIILRNSTGGDIQFDNEFAGNILFNTSNIERMRITSSGNVGIGTTMDINKLDVAGNINVQGGNGSYLTFNNGDANIVINNNGSGKDLSFKTYDGSSNSERMRIDKDGNVGIGTTSPAAKLQVRIGGIGSSANDEVDGVIFEGDRHDLIYKQIRTAASSDWNSTTVRLQTRVDTTLMSSIDFVTDSSYNRHIDINTASNAFNTRFTHNGRVGIGTTSPNKTLSVNGEIFQKTRLNLQRGSSGATTLIQFLNEVGTDRAHIDFGGTNEELSFFAGAGSSEHMRITAAGTVGIGTTNPSNQFVIKSGSNVDMEFGSEASSCFIQTYNRSSNTWGNLRFITSGAETMRLDTSGRVGIGTTSPTRQLHILNSSGDNRGIMVENTVATSYAEVQVKAAREFRIGTGGSSSDSNASDRFYIFDATAAAHRFTISSTGNVGIGATTIPADHRLQIHNPSATYSRFALTNSATGSASGDGLKFQIENLNAIIKNQENGYLTFGTNGRETDLRIDSSGNVGIGTDSPDGKLQVTAASSTTSNGNDASFKLYLTNTDTTNNNYSLINFTDSDGGSSSGGMGLQYTDHANNYGDLCFITRGSGGYGERMRIASSSEIIFGNSGTNNAGFLDFDGTSVQINTQRNPNTGAFVDSAKSNGSINIVGADGGSYIRFNTAAANNTTATERMRIDSSGSVGIANSSPSSFTAAVSTSASLVIGSGITSVSPGITLWQGNSAQASLNFASANTGTGQYEGRIRYVRDTGKMDFRANGNDVMLFDSAGNVGIGTSSPDQTGYGYKTLTIMGGTTAGYAGVLELLTPSTDANGQNLGIISFGSGGTRNAMIGAVRQSGNNNGKLEFWTAAGANGIENRMTIDADGQVGIGTTSPQSYNTHGRNLVVAGGGNVGITIDGAGTSSCSICFADGTSSTASIAGKIEYDHSADTMEFRTAAITRMALNSSSLTVSGDVIAFGSPSDKRYKENIKPVTNALDKVSKLQGVTFDWKEIDSILDIKEDIGFIAQDVQKVIPELVRKNEDGMLSMRHQGIAPILLEAIKELKAEVEELKSNKCNCNK